MTKLYWVEVNFTMNIEARSCKEALQKAYKIAESGSGDTHQLDRFRIEIKGSGFGEIGPVATGSQAVTGTALGGESR
jgi:hypothetical protein